MNTAVSGKSVSARIADRLAQTIGPRRYSMWFDRAVKLDYHDRRGQLEVAVPNQFVAQWVDRHFRANLHEAATGELGRPVALAVRIDPALFGKNSDPGSTLAVKPAASAARAAKETPPGREDRWAQGKLRYRLDDFVIGPSNELAFSAASRLVDEENGATNPLFIHGGCGLGKTHLLQGLCRKLLAAKPNARVLYTTGEHFTNEFLWSIRSNKIDQFRKKIRRLDLLAVDDVHFLADKQATQQEFLHSFDAIDMSGARVVLASDNHPSLVQQFSEALVSRFMRGMVVQVHPPDGATRTQIVRALAGRRGLSLLDNAAEALAGRCVGSIRDIEGTLTKLHALALLADKRRTPAAGGEPGQGAGGAGGVVVGMTLIDQLSASELQRPRSRAIQLDTILEKVVEMLGLGREQVLGSGRQYRAVLARSLVVYLARQMTTMSYPEIASAMGRRTHSTIITAAQRIEKQLSENLSVVLPKTLEQVSVAELLERLKQVIARVA